MRDIIARTTATALIALVVLLAALFAHRHNRARVPATSEPATAENLTPLGDLDPGLVERGREVWAETSCSRCHAIAGRGNPRSPLDAIGARRSRSSIRAWATAAPSVQGGLSRSVVRSKQEIAGMPAEDLDALAEYLASLR